MHWLNSDHSYAYHIAGSCKTPDEAHRVIASCLANRELAVGEAAIRRRQREIKIARLQARVKGADSIDSAEASCELDLIALHARDEDRAYQVAQHECETMRRILAALELHCKYVGRMPIDEAYQACQRDERAALILERAHNAILTRGTLDTETLREAQAHPDREGLARAIETMAADAREGRLSVLSGPVYAALVSSPVDVPRLLEAARE